LAAGLILKQLLLIQLFELEAKSMRGLPARRSDGPFILSDISQTNKDNGNTRFT